MKRRLLAAIYMTFLIGYIDFVSKLPSFLKAKLFQWQKLLNPEVERYIELCIVQWKLWIDLDLGVENRKR